MHSTASCPPLLNNKIIFWSSNLDTFPSFCALVDVHALCDSSIYREAAMTPQHLIRKNKHAKLLPVTLFLPSHLISWYNYHSSCLPHCWPTQCPKSFPITSCQHSPGLTASRCSLMLSFSGWAPNALSPCTTSGRINPLLAQHLGSRGNC